MGEELTQKELNRLYSISVIPLTVVTTIVAFYYFFYHFAQIYPPDSIMLDAFLNMFPPLLTVGPATFFLTFEILCKRRMKSPVKFHVKRFLGRMVELLIFVSFFVAVYLVSYFFLAPVISEKYAMLCSFFLWAIVTFLALIKFKNFFDKLEKVKW